MDLLFHGIMLMVQVVRIQLVEKYLNKLEMKTALMIEIVTRKKLRYSIDLISNTNLNQSLCFLIIIHTALNNQKDKIDYY
jgi:lysyl-tRNA synthetase class II